MKESHIKTFVPRISSAPPDEGEPDLKAPQSFNLFAEEFKPKAKFVAPVTAYTKKELRADASSYEPAVKTTYPVVDAKTFEPVVKAAYPISDAKIYEPLKKQLSVDAPAFTLDFSASSFVPSFIQEKKLENIPDFDIAAIKTVKELPVELPKSPVLPLPETQKENGIPRLEEQATESSVKVEENLEEYKEEILEPEKAGIAETQEVIKEAETVEDHIKSDKPQEEPIVEDEEDRSESIEIPEQVVETAPKKRVYDFEDIKNFKLSFLKDPNFFIIPQPITNFKDRVVDVVKVGRSNKKGEEKRFRETIAKITWRKAKTAEEQKISEKAKEYTRKFQIPDSEQEKIKKQVRITLNKLSPNNQEKLTNEILETCKKSHDYLKLVVAGIFEKAWSEVKYTQMYSGICKFLKTKFEEYKYEGIDENKLPATKNYFKYELLYMCEETFKKGSDEADMLNCNEEEKQEKLSKLKKKTLGNVRFIGELFNVNLITANIVLECVTGLLDLFERENNEDRLEGACVLLLTGAGSFERPKLKSNTDMIYERLERISREKNISAKNKFKIMDLNEFRLAGWKSLEKNEPKKIEEIHADHFMEQNEILKRHGYNN